MRQVTHALLTRPPLSFLKSTRRLQSKNFVRLACVKHAASVHPEPGSNSHVKVLIPVKIRLANFNRYYCCFGFVLNVLLNFKAYQKAFVLRIFRVLHTVQFSRFFVVVSATAHIFYHKYSCLSTTFLIYFLFFFFQKRHFFNSSTSLS